MLAIPGLLLSGIVAMAGAFISGVHGSPAILFTVFLGMALNSASADQRPKAGLAAASGPALRIGVALLGSRITAGDIAALGAHAFTSIAAAIGITVGFGIVAARALGLSGWFGVLTGRAMGICSSGDIDSSSTQPNAGTRSRILRDRRNHAQYDRDGAV